MHIEQIEMSNIEQVLKKMATAICMILNSILTMMQSQQHRILIFKGITGSLMGGPLYPGKSVLNSSQVLEVEHD